MSSWIAAHAQALFLGLLGGAAYYVVARTMHVGALAFARRRPVAAVLAGFVVRLLGAGGAVFAVLAVTDVDPGALCLGLVTGYTVVLGGEASRYLRRNPGAGLHRREAAHGR